jgi:hypothetical protein
MKDIFYITSHVVINQHGLKSDAGIYIPSFTEGDLDAYFVEIYKSLGISYPKFFKMDTMSKLGFIASEILLHPLPNRSKFGPRDVGIILANAAASLDTDLKYVHTISDAENYFPSPAVFVYTLPNIVIGEICIRNKFMGENSFLISEKFDPDMLLTQAELLLSGEYSQACMLGWIEVLKDKFEAVFYFVEKAQPNSDRISNFELNLSNLNHIYRL